jgi:hypothetical protein
MYSSEHWEVLVWRRNCRYTYFLNIMTDDSCFELAICKWEKAIVRKWEKAIVRSRRGRQRLPSPQKREEDRKWGSREIGR